MGRAALACALFGLGPVLHAQDGKAILDALVRKGVLTQEEAAEITKEANKATTSVVVVAGGKSTAKLSIGGRLQIQYDGLSTNIDGTAADPAATNHFFARRAYLTVKGSLGNRATVDITYDLASTSFDAAFIKWKQSSDLAFDLGLRKVNLAYEESMISSGALKSIERTGATRFFVEPANGRRLGAGGYRIGLYAEGKSGPLFWGAAVTNPERVSSITSTGAAGNNGFAYWGNAGLKNKFQDGAGTYVIGGGIGLLPDQGGKTLGAGDDLLVGNVYADINVGSFFLVAEYLFSRNDNGAGPGRDANSRGFWIQPSFKFDKNWEGVVRFSHLDSDGRGINLSDGIRSAPSGGTMDKLTDYYLGFIYYISGNDLKFQAGYVYGEAKDTVTGGSAKARTSGVRSQMQVQF